LWQGCWTHVDAARAGHVRCLARLAKKGQFLPLGSPGWEAAGEARKAEVLEAAVAGCSGGHAHVLAWLFSSAWPPPPDAALSCHTEDLWDVQEDFAAAFPFLDFDREPLPLEYKLYCCAVKQPTSACLEAVLEAGCRSAWLCRIAAREGKADFLALAAKRGCPLERWVWMFAADKGDCAVLELLASDEDIRSIVGEAVHGERLGLPILAAWAAKNAQWNCLQILKRWD
jgi:hypothetical protein